MGELSAQLYGAADPAKTVAFASMISGIAAALTGQSAQGVAIASGAGANAAQNNYLTHQQAENKKTELSKAKTPQERAAIEAKYQQLDNAQQTAAEQCLLAGQCQSVTDPLMLQGALNDLKNACAVPRYCSPDEVKSITQLNRLLDQDAITPNHLLEELVIGGGVGKIVGAGVSTVAARLFGGAIGKAAETIGVNGGAPIVLDLFGGRTSQIPGAINVDISAMQGIRASATKLPFQGGIADKVVASNPYIQGGSGIMDFLPGAADALKPGGQLIINATQRNPFGMLPSVQTLESLGLRVVQENVPLLPSFEGNVFRFTDGRIIPNTSIRTTILEKVK
ncbi:MAG: hypothetical protein V4528_10505 [Pseudomonadota bacterium]